MTNTIIIKGDEDGFGATSNYKPVGDFAEGVQYAAFEEDRYGTAIKVVVQISTRIDGENVHDYLYEADGQELRMREGETCAQAVYRFLTAQGIDAALAE
jgi:hypothetical protein